ncbi:MAG: ABC transporter permease [Desulfurococcaceae archaeon]
MEGLKRYLIRRALTFIPTIVGVLILTFVISHVIPADPARLWAGGVKARPEVIELMKEKYHLNLPIHEQLAIYIKDVFTGNWRESPMTKRPVLVDLAEYFPATAELAIVAGLIQIALGIPLGLLAALKRDTLLDHLIRVLALVGVSAPAFWLAIALQWIFYYSLGLLPATGRGVLPSQSYTGLYILDSLIAGDWNALVINLRHIALPSLTLAFTGLGIIARVVRNTTLDVLSSEFIDFAEARGLSNSKFYRHVVKNSSIPIVTIAGLEFGMLLSGAIIVETVFSWPGIGLYAVNAINSLDYPAIMGSTLLISLIFIVANFVVDIAYAIIDPRVRL